jgi:hypothetical protein
MMEIISRYGSPLDAYFAFVALVYLITICLCFDSTKRTYATQMFLTILNVILVVCSYLTDSTFLLVMWLICLCCNGYTLREIRSKKED